MSVTLPTAENELGSVADNDVHTAAMENNARRMIELLSIASETVKVPFRALVGVGASAVNDGDLMYPWRFRNAQADWISGFFMGRFEGIDVSAPVAFKARFKTTGAPVGTDARLAIQYRVTEADGTVRAASSPGASGLVYSLAGISTSNMVDVTFVTALSATSLGISAGATVSLQFRRWTADDTLGTDLLLAEPDLVIEYTRKRIGG